MTKEQEEFLKSFKAGEYAALTLLVDTKDLKQLISVLQNSGIKTALMPHVKSQIDFEAEDNGDNSC